MSLNIESYQNHTKTIRFCPVCNSNLFTHFADQNIVEEELDSLAYASRKPPEFMSHWLVICKNCNLVYAPSPPSNVFLEHAYSEADFDSNIEAKSAASSYSSALKKLINEIKVKNCAVDVGAGSGPFLPWLVSVGFSEVVGIEPSKAAIRSASKEVQEMLIEGMFNPDLLSDKSVSMICSFMTLEHMAKPREFIQDAYDLLEIGGAIALVVHDWKAPLNRLLGLRSPIIDVEHLQLFDKKSVEELLQNTGFNVIKIESIKNTYPLRYWIRLTPIPSSIKTLLIKLFITIGLADTMLSFNVGNILAFAKKE